ncbi:hypothetical protein ES702_06301 [subsurface metagenome]
MKIRIEGEEILFELTSKKEVTVTWTELKDLETLIKILRDIAAKATPKSLLLRL